MKFPFPCPRGNWLRRKLAASVACSLLTGCGLASLTSSGAGKPDSGTAARVVWSSESYFQALTDIPASQLAAAEGQLRTMPVSSYYTLLKSLARAAPVEADGHTFANPAAAIAAQASLYQALGERFSSVGALWSALGLTRTPPTAASVQRDLARVIAADAGVPLPTDRKVLDLVSYSVLSGVQRGIDCDSYLPQLESVTGITRYAIARYIASTVTRLLQTRQNERSSGSSKFVGPDEVNLNISAVKNSQDGAPPILYGGIGSGARSGAADNQPSAILNNCFEMKPDYGPDEWAGWPDTQ